MQDLRFSERFKLYKMYVDWSTKQQPEGFIITPTFEGLIAFLQIHDCFNVEKVRELLAHEKE